MPADERGPSGTGGTARENRVRLVFLQSASFKAYPDDVELHVIVSPRKKAGAIRRYLDAGWGLVSVERVAQGEIAGGFGVAP